MATTKPSTGRTSALPFRRSTTRSRAASRDLGRRGVRGGCLEKLGDRFLDPVRDDLEVPQRVEIGQQAEVDAAVVGHDRHEQGLVRRQEANGEYVLELAAEDVERDLRTRDVRDDEVEEPRREVDPGRLGEERRRSEVVEARDHLRPERLL